MSDVHIPMKSINTHQDESILFPFHQLVQCRLHIIYSNIDKDGNNSSMQNPHYSLLYSPQVVRTIAEEMDIWDGLKKAGDELAIVHSLQKKPHNRKMVMMV